VRQLFRWHRDPVAQLSTREREVLALIAEGHSNAAIARLLFLAGLSGRCGPALVAA